MNDLPALYAAVCAKRPELAVPHLSYRTWEGDPSDGLWLALDAWECESEIPPTHAAALILARWVEEMPDGTHLFRGHGLNGRNWSVDPCRITLAWYPTPIEALAAFYLGDTQ